MPPSEQRDRNAPREEFAWIDWLRARETAASSRADLPVPIGDDAAVWRPAPGRAAVLTVDAQVEGVHFRRAWMSLREIGQRAVTVSVSDLAAMGARPRVLLVSTVLASGVSAREFRALHGGIHDAAGAYDATVVGGNLSSGPMAIHITAIGEARVGDVLRRAGARVGDVVWVTGTPGLAHLGLVYLLEAGTTKKRAAPSPRPVRPALRAFRRPWARVTEALHLVRYRSIGGAIDVSDGLASDVGHVVVESSRALGDSVGAELDAEALLALPGLAAASRALGVDPLEAALFGGEAYELCFTTTPAFAARGARSFRSKFETPLTPIGRIIDRPGVFLRRGDGTSEEVSSEGGWDHFGGPLTPDP